MIYDRVKQQSLSIKLVKRQLIGRSNAPKKRRRNNKVGFICEIMLGLDDDELSYPTMFLIFDFESKETRLFKNNRLIFWGRI